MYLLEVARRCTVAHKARGLRQLRERRKEQRQAERERRRRTEASESGPSEDGDTTDGCSRTQYAYDDEGGDGPTHHLPTPTFDSRLGLDLGFGLIIFSPLRDG